MALLFQYLPPHDHAANLVSPLVELRCVRNVKGEKTKWSIRY